MKPLTREEEKQLAKRIESGDQEARKQFIMMNLGLIRMVAKNYHDTSKLEYDDLVQEAIFGLMTAVNKFNYRRGCKFSTYAVRWIEQSVRRAIKNQGRTIRVPEHVYADLSKISRFSKEFQQQFGTAPTKEEIASGTGISLEKLGKISKSFPRTVSMSTPIGRKNEKNTLGECLVDEESESPEETTNKKEQTGILMGRVLNHLPRKERKILEMRFGIGMKQEHTLEAIGKQYGVCRERVRQIEKDSFKKLRGPCRKLGLHK